MIDPHWQVIDLDPITWRNLGPFLEPQSYIAAAQPGEHGLFILHDGGRLLKVVDTETHCRPDGIPEEISDPEALAQELFARGTWQRVHVIDRRHLAWVAQQAQATPHRDLTLDEYSHLVYTLIWDQQGGYVCVPTRPDRWHGWTYGAIRDFRARLPSPASLALGVYSERGLAIGLILVCGQGRIRHVTTFEALGWQVEDPGPNQQTLAALRDALEAQFAPPAAVLLCSEAAFSGWLAADDKLKYLAEAESGTVAMWSPARVP